MAITPSKPSRIDVGSISKTYVFLAPTIAVTSDTLNVTGLKEVWDVAVASRPTLTWSYTSTGVNGTVVLTVGVTASCTGGQTPLLVMGR